MANIPQIQKILIVRTDRIGDVVLSLPMVVALRSAESSASISLLVRSYTKELVEDQPGLAEILLYDVSMERKPFGEMLAEIRRRKFDVVIVTYPTFRLALLMFLAGIPVRIGTGYRWYSLFFNRRIYEHRKTAEKHEAEYNVSLLRPLGIEPEGHPRPALDVTEAAAAEARELLGKVGIRPGEPFVILHPGSGGSAKDWSPENFGALAEKVSDVAPVLVTGSAAEQQLVATVVEQSNGKAVALPAVSSLKTLAAILKKAAVFVANSTGPLHMAAAVGTPVVAFYPPIVQCSSRRWGPLADRKVVFEPSAGECPRCHGGPCQGSDCMDLISVEEVFHAVAGTLKRSPVRGRELQKA